MRGIILFADSYDKQLLNNFASVGWEVLDASQATRLELLDIVADAEILIVRSRTVVNEILLKNAPLLKLVIRGGSGTEHIDKNALAERNIRLITTPEANCNAVGEQAVGMLLSLLNNIIPADRALRNFQWIRTSNKGREIAHRTVGIIGYGFTGQAFARKLKGFEAEILAYDKYKSGYSDGFVTEVNLEQIFESADVISFHVPFTTETRHYLNHSFINNMKHPFWLLNLSRGEIVRTGALIEGLHSGKILGAGLDVFENENFSKLTEIQAYELKALIERDNVVLTPHIGGLTYESEERILASVASAVTEYVTMQYGGNKQE